MSQQDPHPFDPVDGQPAPTAAPSAQAPHTAAPAHPPRESRLKHVGGALGGLAAFIAAATTAWVNLKPDKPAPPAQPHTSIAAPVDGPVRRRIGVERILVDHDGSPGTTDWRFEVDLAGERVMAFQQNGLDDGAGLNIATPNASAVYPVPRKGGVSVTVRGWRLGPMHSSIEPDAVGTGTLGGDGAIAPIPVQATEPDNGAFVFHFNAATAE